MTKESDEKIKTLVYFDLEATGLRNIGRPRISELSLIAIDSQCIHDLHSDIQNHLRKKSTVNKIETILPRVLNKITLCVYPMTTIKPEVTDITGLDNYNLVDQTRFDENTAKLIIAFLARLPPPICLVAHNGNLYDFPLIKAEMEKVDMQFSHDILCADSYLGIKSLLHRTQDKPKSFSLVNLHKHLLGAFPAKSHGAEEDCLALLRTTAAIGKDWLNWVENNYEKLSDCKKMWSWT